MEILEHIYQANQVANNLKDLQGRVTSLQLGIVTNNQDPLGLARVQATVAALGARTVTDWLLRNIECPLVSYPVPNVGDTVIVGYLDGDPHKGFYTGLVQNNLNPAGSPDSFNLIIGNSLVLVSPASIVLTVGNSVVTIVDGSITIATDKGTLTLGPDPAKPKYMLADYQGYSKIQAHSLEGSTTIIWQDNNYSTLP